MISSDPSFSLFLGKKGNPTGRRTGKWHLFDSEKCDAVSLCGHMSINEQPIKLDTREVNRNLESVKSEMGLGDLCGICREWVAGAKSSGRLPRNTTSGKRYGTGESILEKYRE